MLIQYTDSLIKYSLVAIECVNGNNCLYSQMYNEWIAALEEAKEDPKTVITAMTGAGNYYCSGNDLSNFTNINPNDMHQLAKDSGVLLNRYVLALNIYRSVSFI